MESLLEGAALVLQQRLFSLAFFLLFFVRECFLFSVLVLLFQSKKNEKQSFAAGCTHTCRSRNSAVGVHKSRLVGSPQSTRSFGALFVFRNFIPYW